MKPLPKNYDHKEAEPRWQKRWGEARIYAWEENLPRSENFVIDTPPPTVSGVLHMGHIFSYTQADFVARYQRMKGKTVFYPMGFDDNGLPTERLVEKIIKKRAGDMTREAFIAECEKVTTEARREFRNLFTSVALSVDWAQEYHTISDESRKISQLSFLDLYRKGHAYRQLQPMLWDPVDQTAIAQAEVVDKEMASHMNYIRFGIEGEDSFPLPPGEGGAERRVRADDSPPPREKEGVRAYSSKELVIKARELREDATNIEKLLWLCLRDRQLRGYKFRRQHPVKHFIADFACLEAMLIVELDGGHHNEEGNIKKDTTRTALLEAEGFKVMRFWNNEVNENLEGVMDVILNALKERCPHPDPLPEGEGIVIATTRPELIPACVGVFYHPDDARYKHLKGKQAITPLFGVKVPILEDDTVEMEKGTGIMMCCTFGDEKDIEKWRTHELTTRVILNKYGKIDFSNCSPLEGERLRASGSEARSVGGIEKTVSTPHDSASASSAPPQGGSVFDILQGKKASNPDPKHPGAREIIIELLKEQNLLKDSKPITHAVKCAERSGAPLEILPTPQWFVKVLDKKEALHQRTNECNWYPEYMRIRMEQWIDGLKWDWCISRQRYYGVPFPVWYSKRAGEEGKILIAEPDQLPINPLASLPKGYTRDEVEPEADVMDTWAISSVSPQLSSKGIKNDLDFVLDPQRHVKLFPADLRPQAHEIIRTWAFYTIVKAHLHENTIPWKNLMISGWCLAPDKTKMSKSKGNVITPVELIVEKGADVVRYWASTSRLGADTAFSEDVLKIGKKLVTKLWNATNFASIQLQHLLPLEGGGLGRGQSTAEKVRQGIITETLDKWILARLHKTIRQATEEFERFEYCEARIAVEDFFWNDFCDNYLELVKVRAYGEKDSGKNSPPLEGGQASETSREGYKRSIDTPHVSRDTLDRSPSRGEQILHSPNSESRIPNLAQQSALHTIYHCLDTLLRLFAPFVPHVTDELYSHLFEEEFAAKGSIHARGNWPEAKDYPQDEAAEQSGIACVEILNAIRKAKSEKNLSIKYPVDGIVLDVADAAFKISLMPLMGDLMAAGNVAKISWGSPPPDSHVIEDNGRRVGVRFAEQSDVA